MANAITYIKNVGKSVGYASFDVIKEMNPVFSDFAETNGELATDMYKSIRNLKNKSKDIPNKIMESEYGKFGKTYLDNLFSDIKTGKLYNKERKAKYDSEAADAMMGMDGDFGFEDDFNFDDIDSFDDDEPSTNDMLDIVGEKTSNSINTTLARTAEYIVEGTTASNKAIYNQINNIYGGLHTGLATINQNISKMIEFHNEGTMTHYENSRTFFQESTRLDQERNQYLKEISESLKQLNGPETNQKSTKSEYRKNTYSDMVTYEGVLDISRYGQNIKKNLKDKSGGVFDMLNMMIETGMLNTLAASPLEGLTKIMVSSVIPNAVEKSMENLNKSLSGMVGNALLGMKNKAKESSIWEGISEIFGINTNIQTKLDPSKYEKGKIPFDGITKKAIVEVIPTYLAKILSAVSGSKENRFDYENGKFVTIDQLRSEYDNLTKTSANKAAYGIDNVVRSKTRKLGWDENRQRQFDEDWEVIKEYMFRHQKNFNTRDKKLRGSSFGLKGELADENVRLLQKILDGNPEMLRYADQLFKEIDTHNRRMVDLQNSGSMTAIENGSIKEPKTPASGTSTYAFATSSNGTILSELVAIHKELSYIRVYGSGRASSKKGKGGPKPSFDKFNIPEPRIGNYNQYDKDINKNASDHYDNLSDEELDERTARILATAENETIVDSDRKTFSERMHEASTFSAKMSVLVQSASELAKKPGEFVVAMMDKADARLYDIVYGPKEDKEGKKSFIGRLFKGLEGMFDKFSDFVTDTIIEPLKGKFTKESIHDAAKKFFGIFGIDLDKTVTDVKTYLFGKKDDEGNRTKNGLFGKFVDSFKSEMSGAFKWVKNAFKDVGDWAGITAKKKDKPNTVDTIINAVSDTTEAASGLKRVNKTGLAVISEGEMVLPPDMNPFNVSKRKRNEKNFKRDLISSIANADEYAEGKDEKGEKFNREDYERLPFWVRMSDTFMEGSTKFFEQLSQNIGLDKKDTDKFKDNAVDFIGKIKEYGGTMAAGATIGAGVSVLTGLIGGPLVGAAVGAGVGLIKKSETVQNMLFGEIDERTGERKGSKFISKDLANNISKYLPDMAKGATVGGILTALPFVPGGPVAGVILGSALGFAKNNEKVQESLFGEGKLLGTKENFQKKVQSVLPKIGVGALAGLLAGPFGLTTNLILGSALGFASDTNKFKDLMFGKEDENGIRDGGIFGAVTKPAKEFFSNMYTELRTFVKEKMFQPVADAIAPLKKQFEMMGESILNHFKESFKMHVGAPLQRALEEKVINPLGKFFGGLITMIMKPVKTVISAPFRLIGAVGNRLRDKHVKSGNADYMGAEQRNAYRESRGGLRMWNDKYTEWDQSLANMDSEGIDAAKVALEGIRGSRTNVKRAAKDSYDKVYKTLYGDKNISLKISKTALQILKDGGYEQAQKFVREANIPEESKNKVLQVLVKESAKLKINKQMKQNADGTVDQVAAQLKSLGFDIDPAILKGLAKGDKESEKLYRMILGEQKYRKDNKIQDPVTELNKDEDKRHNEVKKILTDIRGLLAKLNGEDIKPESEQYKEDLQNYEKRYNFVSGLSDNPEDELAADPEKSSIINSYRVGKYNATEYLKDKAGQARQFTGNLYKGAKGKLGDIRNSDVMNSIFGDKNVDWRNPIGSKLSTVPTDEIGDNIKKLTGVMIAQARKDGIDTTNIDSSGDSETYFNKIKNKFNKAKNTVTQFVNGRKVQYKRDKNGEYDIDAGDKETKDFFEEEKQKQEREKGILGSLTNLPNTLGNIFGKIFGKKSEEEKSWFEKLMEKIGTPVKVAAATATAFGVLGWAEEKIFPGLKVFWDDHMAPYLNEAWQGRKDGFGQFIYFFNPQNPGGLLAKFKEYFPKFMQTAATYISSGMNWALRNVLPTVVSTLVQNLPVILKGTVTGLLDGLNNLLFNKGKKNDGRMADLDNIESQLGSRSLFSGMTPTSTPSWFDKSVNIEDSKVPAGGTIKLSSVTAANKTIAVGTVDRITAKTNTSATPKAFDTMNQTYRSSALKEYEKVKSNVIDTPYGKMSVSEILNSDKQFATNTETGEPIYGYELLNYNNTAQQLGMNVQLSDEEIAANTLAKGGGNKTTIQGKVGGAGIRSFMRGLVGNSTGVTRGSKLIKSGFNLIGDVTKILPGIGKPVSAITKTTGKVLGDITEFPNKLGRKVSGKTVVEAVSEAAKDTKNGAFKKFAKSASNSKLGKFISMACEAITGLLKESKVATLIAEAIVHVKGKTSKSVIKSGIDKFGDFLVKKLPDLLQKYGGKLGGKAAIKLGAYTASAATLLVADAVISFISGYNNANTILGITQDPDLPYRVLCGFIEALNSVLCLGLVPLNVLVDLVISGSNLLGLDRFNNLEKQRELARQEVEKFNKENGTDFSVEEYNKKDKLTTKAKNALSKAGDWIKSKFTKKKETTNSTTDMSVATPTSAASSYIQTKTGMGTNIPSYAAMNGRGSGLYVGRGSAENKHFIQTVKKSRDEELRYNDELSRNTFISQIDSRYRDQKFNISGDTETQTLGDTGCAPAAAAMAINSSLGNNKATMEDSSRFALKYKVKNDGVNATYFNDEFARYGINAKYIASSNTKVRSNEIMKQLAENNRVVLMGEDHSNTTKANSPFGPNAHYVVANGLSEDGKFIYINDPESKVPNIKYPTNKVLTSSKLGIAANVARGSKLITNKLKEFVGSGTLPGSSVAEQCWNFLKSNGFTDEAAAGMLGNFMQESSMNPKECRNGRGPAGGLCQWETYGKYNTAWGEMANFAKSRGQDWTDLESQLLYLLQSMPKQFKWYTGQTGGTYNSKYADANGRHWYKNGEWAWWPEKMTVEQFKALKDVALATEIFERVYERASHPMMNKRIQFAQEFYNKFSGKYTPVTGTSSTSTITADTTTTTTTESTGSNSSDTVINKIYGVFNGLAEAYGLKAPSSSSSDITNSSSDSTSSTKSNSSYGGYVSSNPEMAAKQVALVDKMYSVKGTLKYAQGNAKYPGSRNPEDGSGDCSSTVQWAYKNILGVDPGDWTGAQRTDSDTYTVATSTADESKLQLGDLLLKNGHVEMYAGDNQMIGHGGGATGKVLGPTVKTLDKTGKYNLVRRWVGFKGHNSVKASQANTSASGINVSGSASGNTVSDPALAQKQKSLVNLMYSYKGKLKYGQNNAQYPGTRNPDEGGADCSSMIQYAYKKVLGVDPGSWTQPQRTDPDTYTVATNVNDESKLQLGDMLLMPGHVEMYAGNSTIIGQNAGTIYGPNTQPLHKQFNLVRRWVGFRGKGSGLPLSSYNGRGTGGTDVHLEDKPFIDPMIKQTAPNSAQDNALRYINSGSKETFTSIIPPGITNNLNQKKASNMSFIKGKLKTVKVEKPPVNVVGKGSEIESIKTENNNLRVNVNNNNTSNNDLLLVVKSILQLMIQLVTNTDQLNNIAKLLGEYLTTVNSSDGSKESKQATLLAKQNLINAMQSGSNNNSNKPNAQLLALIEATEKIARE